MRKYIVAGIFFFVLIIVSLVTGTEQSLLKFSYGEKIESFDKNLEWHFVQGEFVNPAMAKDLYEQGEVVSIPHRFVNHFGDMHQYGTYIAKLTIPKSYTEKRVAVYVPFEYGSYKLFFDQYLMAENGVVAAEKEAQVPQMKPVIGQFQIENREVYITMQFSNFYSNRGGFGKSLEVGKPSEVLARYNTSIISSYFVNGIIFIIGLFSLLLGVFNRRNKEALLFALFCIVIAIRSIYARPFTYSVTLLDVPWLVAVKIEAICALVIVWIALDFCYNKFAPRLPKGLLYAAYTLLGLQFYLSIATEPAVFQVTFQYVLVIELLFIVYMIIEVFRCKEFHKSGYAMHIFGVGIVVLSAMHDLIVVALGYNAPMLIHFAVFIYVLLMVYSMSKQFALKLIETEKLNEEIMQMNEMLDNKIKERTLELEEANKRLNVLATKDALTGISNRYVFDSQLKYYFEEAILLEEPLSLLLFDLDSFKKYNDHYGHVYGDKLLQQVVEAVKKVLPPGAIFARYGGEEFAIISPHTDSMQLKALGQQVVEAVARERFEHVGQACGFATISVGGCTFVSNHSFYTSPKQFIKATDEQLYLAKQQGRNRFVMKEEKCI